VSAPDWMQTDLVDNGMMAERFVGGSCWPGTLKLHQYAHHVMWVPLAINLEIQIIDVQSRAQSVSSPRTGSGLIARTSSYSLTTSVLVLCRTVVIFSHSVQ
jgi:hypothetical protein